MGDFPLWLTSGATAATAVGTWLLWHHSQSSQKAGDKTKRRQARLDLYLWIRKLRQIPPAGEVKGKARAAGLTEIDVERVWNCVYSLNRLAPEEGSKDRAEYDHAARTAHETLDAILID